MKPCTINHHEILLNETDNGGGHEEMCVDYADNSDIPATETFKCLLNFDLLQDLLAPTQQLQSIIVLREYEYLWEILEDDSRFFFVVTGQPGTSSSSYCPQAGITPYNSSCRKHPVCSLPTPLPP